MRVTTAGQTHTIIARLQRGQQQLAEAQRRATTGLKVERLSDDPTAGARVMQAAAGIRGAAQYTRNADRIVAQLDAEDAALQQLADVMGRAKELGAGALSVTNSRAGRAASALELRELVTQTFDLANQSVGGEFLFGGLTSDGRPPFDPTAAGFVPTDPAVPPGAPVPRYPTGQRAVEVGPAGQRLLGAHDGTTIFLGRDANGAPDASKGVIPALKALETALAANDLPAIDAAMSRVDTAFNDVQARVGELGARQTRADLARTALAALDETLVREKSELSEVDAEQAITEMLARQTAYQAAMLASSRVMGMSLADYLR